MVGNLKLEQPSSSLLSRHVAMWGEFVPLKTPKYGGQGGDMLCSGVLIATKKRGVVVQYVDASKQMPFCLTVSLRTPGGERVQLQIINSVTLKQKSRTCLSLDVSLRFRALASVFVARTNQSLS